MRGSKEMARVGLLALTLALVGSLVGWAFAAAAGSEDGYRDVEVEMANFTFEPQKYVVMPGEKIRFHVKNPTTVYHTFTVMRSMWDREKPLVDADVAPGKDGVYELTMPDEEIALFLVCVPHEVLGMVGEIVVTANPEGANRSGE